MSEEPTTTEEEKAPFTAPTDVITIMLGTVGAAELYLIYESWAANAGITELLLFTGGFWIFLYALRMAERHLLTK